MKIKEKKRGNLSKKKKGSSRLTAHQTKSRTPLKLLESQIIQRCNFEIYIKCETGENETHIGKEGQRPGSLLFSEGGSGTILKNVSTYLPN
jgi:hypothetical protein